MSYELMTGNVVLRNFGRREVNPSALFEDWIGVVVMAEHSSDSCHVRFRDRNRSVRNVPREELIALPIDEKDLGNRDAIIVAVFRAFCQLHGAFTAVHTVIHHMAITPASQ